MKTKTIFLFALMALFLSANAQSVSYDSVMIKSIRQIHDSENSGKLVDLAGRFERIAQAKPSEWLPLYYSAYCYIFQAFAEKDGKQIDLNVDKAQVHIEKAMAMAPTESELLVLQAMAYQARIGVNPMMRGMKYSGMASDALDMAEKLNASNPRIYFIRGQSAFNTPKMFGGGKDAAKPHFVKAATLFEKQNMENPLSVHWGLEANEQMLMACEQ